ncbi:helix-turn-helix domain-containing protein [Vibrio artabrorum]|uniref:helix-turn-helix domain-containing protein n=1 Tax=Vibrio artabrorum TaxID=446374 RepID=UPI0035509437
MNSLNNTDLKKLASQQKTIQIKVHLLALAHFKDSLSRAQIVKALKVSRNSVNKWVKTFFEEGLEGLEEKPCTGRPAYITEGQRKQLNEFIKKKAESPSGGRLVGSDIHDYIVKL